jgi:hypothetical protein
MKNGDGQNVMNRKGKVNQKNKDHANGRDTDGNREDGEHHQITCNLGRSSLHLLLIQNKIKPKTIPQKIK